MPIAQHFWQIILLLVILVAPLPLGLSLIFIDNNSKKQPHFPHSLLVLLTSWCIIQTCAGILLGTFKQLNLGAVIVAEIIVFLAGCLFLAYLRQKIKFFSFKQLVQWQQPLNRLEILVIGAISFTAIVILERTMTVPITDWDSLWFHLPAIARWYQTASFSLLDDAGTLIFAHPAAGGYPYGWHVISALFVLPFQEDFLVTFPMFIAWVIMGLSVYLLSIKFGATRFYALTAAALVLTQPFFIRIVNTVHIDLPLAAVFMSGLYFAFSSVTNRSYVDFFLFLASLGMLLGIKTSGLVYIALLVAAFIIMLVKLIKSNDNYKIFRPSNIEVPLVITGVFCLIFIGGFWYIKNFVEMGNPLGDIEVKIGKNVLFTGALDPNEARQYSLANRFKLTNFSHWSLLGLQSIARLQLPFLIILGQVLLLPFAFLVKHKKIKNQTLIGLVALMLSTGFLYWNTPYSAGDPVEYWFLALSDLSPTTGDAIRYGFSFIGVLGVVGAVSATITWNRAPVMAVIVLLSSLLGVLSSTLIDASQIVKFTGQSVRGAVIVDKWRHAPGEAIGLILGIFQTEVINLVLYTVLYIVIISIIVQRLFISIDRPQFNINLSKFFRKLGHQLVIVFCLILIIASTFAARVHREGQRYRIYGSTYEYISKNLNSNEKIGYLLSQQSYLLYGKNLNQKLLHIPWKTDEFADWLKGIQQSGTNLVVAGPITSPKKVVSWLKNVDSWFVKIVGKNPIKEPVLYDFKG